VRAAVIVDDRTDRRTRRPTTTVDPRSTVDRPVDLVVALARLAAGTAELPGPQGFAVDVVGWTAAARGDAPALATADLVHVIPGAGFHPNGLDELLAAIPVGPPLLVSVPDRPPMPRFAGRARSPSRRWSDRLPRPAVEPGADRRSVHALTTEALQLSYLEAAVGSARLVSAHRIGPGYDPPALAPAYDVSGPVVLAVTALREAAEAVEILRAVEAIARAGQCPLVVIVGVGGDQSAAARAATFAEASGARVRLLGRAGAREIARWRATATVAVTTDRDPGSPGDLAGLLMAGLPVAAVRNRANKAVAASSTLSPAWYDAGASAELAEVLTALLAAAHAAGRAGPAISGLPSGPRGLVVEIGEVVPPEGAPTGRGPDRHCLPTWEETAEDVLALYREISTGPASEPVPLGLAAAAHRAH